MMTHAQPVKQKPLLRGYFHQEAFFVALGACLLLIAKGSEFRMYLAAVIYSLGLLTMLGISSIYHRVHWEPKPRHLMKKLDHSAIFLQIAGTFTPVCMLALSESSGRFLLILIWIIAALGILQSVFWMKAPKWVNAIIYIVMGWLALPYVGELSTSLGGVKLWLLVIGGFFYTVGAVFYATKWPKFVPHIFGFHELFHIFTIIAAAMHFIVVYQLIQ